MYDSNAECAAERMLRALRDDAGGASRPAAQLASVLGVGEDEAAALAAELRSLGYRVLEAGGAGCRSYRLVRGPAPLALPWEIAGAAGRAAGGASSRGPPRAVRLGSRAVYYGSADSTQERALSLAADAEGGADGLVVVAGTQTAGRGRTGRRWVSPPGGLWMSVVAEPGPPAGAATLVPLAAALALADAVRDAAGIEADLKWPNDLLVGGRKVAGILVDATAGISGGRMDSVIVGIGVNLAVDAAEIDAAAGEPRGHAGAAALAPPRGGRGGQEGPDPALLARAFLARLESELGGLARGGGGGGGGPGDEAGGVARRWAARSSMIGCEVEVECGERTIRGTAAGLDPDGALLVGTGAATERIVAGDVVAVRRARQANP